MLVILKIKILTIWLHFGIDQGAENLNKKLEMLNQPNLPGEDPELSKIQTKKWEALPTKPIHRKGI